MRPLTYHERFELDAPPEALWPLISNVDKVNQLAGFPPVTYELVEQEDGESLVYGSAMFGLFPGALA